MYTYLTGLYMKIQRKSRAAEQYSWSGCRTEKDRTYIGSIEPKVHRGRRRLAHLILGHRTHYRFPCSEIHKKNFFDLNRDQNIFA